MDQARILQLLLYIHLWVVSTDKSTIQKYLVVTAFIEKKEEKKMGKYGPIFGDANGHNIEIFVFSQITSHCIARKFMIDTCIL